MFKIKLPQMLGETPESALSPFAGARRNSNLLVKREVAEAILPSRQSTEAAGYDLFSVEDITDLQPGSRICVSTGISIEVPAGHYGRIAPRSGLAVKNGIQVGAGVVDSDYRGIVRILLFNQGSEPVNLPAGSRVAQLIIERIYNPDVVEITEHTTTDRGTCGFGSTGQ